MINTLKNFGEIAFGILFLVGAIFNLSYTLSHGAEFFGSFADNAWFAPSRKLIRTIVIPRATLFTVLLITLQASVAVLILSRGGFVVTGLIVGATFSLAAGVVSSVGGAIGNLALAAILGLLAFTG